MLILIYPLRRGNNRGRLSVLYDGVCFLRDRLLLFKKVAAAVTYAHGKGVIHRDLKPANILVQGTGEPKLLDFGIARRIEPTRETSITHGFGPMTPAYAAPEQKSNHQATEVSDLYSLGLIMLQLLTGDSVDPVDHGPSEIMTSLLTGSAPCFDRRLPKQLRHISIDLLNEERANRTASADLLVKQLDHFLVGKPTRNRRIAISTVASS